MFTLAANICACALVPREEPSADRAGPSLDDMVEVCAEGISSSLSTKAFVLTAPFKHHTPLLLQELPSTWNSVKPLFVELKPAMLSGVSPSFAMDCGVLSFLALDRAFHRSLLAQFPEHTVSRAPESMSEARSGLAKGTDAAAAAAEPAESPRPQKSGPPRMSGSGGDNDDSVFDSTPGEDRRQSARILYRWYQRCVATGFPGPSEPYYFPRLDREGQPTKTRADVTEAPPDTMTAPVQPGTVPHEVTQAYAVAKGYRLFAIRRHHIQLFVQFSDEVGGSTEDSAFFFLRVRRVKNTTSAHQV